MAARSETRAVAEISARLHFTGIPFGPVADVIGSSQIAARQMSVEIEHAILGADDDPAPPPLGQAEQRQPELGEDVIIDHGADPSRRRLLLGDRAPECREISGTVQSKSPAESARDDLPAPWARCIRTADSRGYFR
jgi:hypothetical protein